MRDLVNNLKLVKAKSHAQVTGTGQGDIIDLQGFNSIMFGILTAATATADADNKFTFGVQEGDLADGSDMATITDTDRILGSAVINAEAQDNVVLKIGAVVGVKRYMRLLWTETGTADATFGAVALLGHPLHAAVAAQ